MIDTSIQLNNHNSYHATELFWADTFSVQTMSHITASFALYSDVVQSAANRIKIRFYTASGAIVSETLHAFAVNTIWERVSVTVAVPATAEKAQICFLAGSYWWAEAKTEEGQTATPYAINAAGQLTWISPNGIYTGTVTAQQVIVSPLSGATEKDLESRLVTINSNAINLKATTDNNVSRLTTIEAGQITLESTVVKKDTSYGGAVLSAANGLTTTAVVAGKTIQTKLNATDGISITNNGSKVFGVDAAGNVFASRLANSATPTAWAITGETTINNTTQRGLFCFNSDYSTTIPAVRLVAERYGLARLSVPFGTDIVISDFNTGTNYDMNYSLLLGSRDNTGTYEITLDGPTAFDWFHEYAIFDSYDNEWRYELEVGDKHRINIDIDGFSYNYKPVWYGGNLELDTDTNSIQDSWNVVSFNRYFSSPPKVVATYFDDFIGDSGAIKIRNITTSGFEWQMGGTWPTSRIANWIALLKI